MAIHHGNVSKYLVGQVDKAKEKMFYIILWSGFIVGALWVYILFQISALNIFGRFVLFFVLMLIVFALMVFLMVLYARKAQRFSKGLKAEKRVYFTLQGLPDTYHTFQSVILAEKKGDIDFIVVGPTGVFTVEVKGTRGVIRKDKDEEITINGKRPDKNPLKQAYAESKVVGEKIGVSVQPILVYVGKVDIRFGENEVQGVKVIGLEWLQRMLQEKSKKHNEDDVRDVVAELCRAWG